MTIEVRYIIFTPEEARRAIVAFILKRGFAGNPDDILGIKINSDAQSAPSVEVQLRHHTTNKTISIASEHIAGALLLYCNDHRIPVPRRAQKIVEPSTDGLTLVLTTDLDQKNPTITGNHVTYTGIANYAQENRQARQDLASAIEHANSAKAMAALANVRAQTAETSAADSAKRLTAITLEPGLRGWLVRRLVTRTLKP
jgi:hypothetical protein